MKKRILFITKNFPPAIGGMEQYCRDVTSFLQKTFDVIVIGNGAGKKGFLGFAMKVLTKGVYESFHADAIWVGDASISFLGKFLSFISGNPFFVTVHALDILRKNNLYQKIIPGVVASADHVVSVSSFTKEICIKKGVSEEKISVIHNGINEERIPHDSILSKEQLEKEIGISLENKKILFSLGRHIERKGIHTFLDTVFPYLGDEYMYLIGGSGPLTSQYESIIAKHDLKNVYLLGRIPDLVKWSLYKHSDVFLMPNIQVDGDAEGFGIVCIESSRLGTPTVGRNLEGIADAIIDGKTGFLVSNYEVSDWKKAINGAIGLSSDNVISVTKEYFSWSHLINAYIALLDQ